MAEKHKQSEALIYFAIVSGELEIDELGRVWRCKKRTWDRWTLKTKITPCKRVRAEIGKQGEYLQVRVMIDGKRHYAAAHRLVWLHFHGPIPDGITINHKDGVKSNNGPLNLEPATYSEQRHHAIQVLGARHADVKGEKHPRAQATESQVIEMRRLRAAGAMVNDLATQFNMRPQAVSAICTRRTWAHIP